MITFLFARPTSPFFKQGFGESPAKKSRVKEENDDDFSIDIEEASLGARFHDPNSISIAKHSCNLHRASWKEIPLRNLMRTVPSQMTMVKTIMTTRS